MTLLTVSHCTLFKLGIAGIYSSLEQTDKNLIVIDIQNLPEVNDYYLPLDKVEIIIVYENPLDLYLVNEFLIDSVIFKFRVNFILKKSPINLYYKMLNSKWQHRRIRYVFHNYLSVKENKALDIISKNKGAHQTSTDLGISIPYYSKTKRSIMKKLEVKSDLILHRKTVMRQKINHLLVHLLNEFDS